jgi:hypothetical protein
MQEQRNEIDVAWAAGLFEGEGCWNIYVRKSGKLQIQAALGMTDGDVVRRFAAIVGVGNMRRHHTALAQAKGEQPMYQWSVFEAEKVREVIALFLPYLGERRRAKALEVLDRGRDIRSHNSKTTHCPKGHPLAGDNLQLEPFRHPNGKEYVARRCKKCRTEQSRERARKRLGITPDRYRTKEI